MVIKYLRKSLKDIDDIAKYIAQDNPDAAKATIQEIRKSIDLLISMPDMGKSGRVYGTRELIKSHYIIPYRVVGNQIQILRVFDTSQKPPKNW